MIRSVVTILNNISKKFNPSTVALVEGRDITTLQEKLEANYESQRKARIAQQAFRVQIATMGKTEAELFTLKRNWLNQTIDMTPEQYGETLERLEDKLEEQRQARSKTLGHL